MIIVIKIDDGGEAYSCWIGLNAATMQAPGVKRYSVSVPTSGIQVTTAEMAPEHSFMVGMLYPKDRLR